MIKITAVLFILFFALSFDLASADPDLDQSESDIYYEMKSNIDENTEANTNNDTDDQIRLTGDKYGLTDQDAKELYQEGNSMELKDE